MKKKLEADLMSIAHRILKMKNKDDVKQLYLESQKLYEKLAVLLFVEENFESTKPTIESYEIEEKLDTLSVSTQEIAVSELTIEEKEQPTITLEEEIEDEEPIITIDSIPNNSLENKQPSIEIEVNTNPETVIKDQTTEIEPNTEEPEIPAVENSELVENEPAQTNTIATTSEKKQISFDEIFNELTPIPVFDRVDELKKEENVSASIPETIEEKVEETKTLLESISETPIFSNFKEITFDKIEEKMLSNLNDKMSKTTGLTLNDRVAFETHLFDGSTEDLNRVISQIATFDNYNDAKNFIEEMVKPDYNDWQGKDEFASRFMEFIESKFL